MGEQELQQMIEPNVGTVDAGIQCCFCRVLFVLQHFCSKLLVFPQKTGGIR